MEQLWNKIVIIDCIIIEIVLIILSGHYFNCTDVLPIVIIHDHIVTESVAFCTANTI